MGNVEVRLTQNSNDVREAQYIEVVGKVDDQGESVREFTCVDLGDNLSESISSVSRKCPSHALTLLQTWDSSKAVFNFNLDFLRSSQTPPVSQSGYQDNDRIVQYIMLYYNN